MIVLFWNLVICTGSISFITIFTATYRRENHKQFAICGRHHNISRRERRHGKTTKKAERREREAGLSLNLKKTKIMTTGTLNEFILNGTEIEITIYHTFLGSMITRDGYDNKEINRRLSIGRMAMTKLEKVMKDWDVKKATKIIIPETIIFPTVTYGSECGKRKEKNRCF
jgi:hypothetical protein